MLLNVRDFVRTENHAWDRSVVRIGVLVSCLVFGVEAIDVSSQTPSPPKPATPVSQTNGTQTQAPQPGAPQGSPQGAIAPQGAAPTPQPGLNVVVLDPAHGGTDPGARGTGGIRESDILLEMAPQVRRALEAQGFQVIQTRLGNDDPSFDDRSAMANAQTSAVFVTLHIGSTGLPGTVRVYVSSNIPLVSNVAGLIPWDRAQIPYQDLSRKLGDLVQSMLAQRFKGSPSIAQTAAVRQLRTTAAPAIAVEISSVVVDDRAELDRMAPGVAEAIAAGVAAFRPSYVVPARPGATP